MLAFITSIRHPLNSNSYQRVVELLDRTLTSVCSQTDPNFRVVVVCNEVPDITHNDKVEFVQVDFAAPSSDAFAETGTRAARLDKGCKYVVGLLHVARYEPSHVMFFDADDYLSHRIAAHVNSHPESNGWVIRDGYLYRDGSYFIRPLGQFYQWNGSCNILRFEHLDVPHQLSTSVSQDELVRHIDPFLLRGVFGAHLYTELYFRVLDKPLECLPFRGAIYVTGTGENHSGMSMTSMGQRVDATFAEEFGLTVPDFDAHRYWRERADHVATCWKSAGERLARKFCSLKGDR